MLAPLMALVVHQGCEASSTAGNGLMGSLRQAGATDAAAELCRDIAEQYPGAAWAQQQLGCLALAQGRAEEAVAALQAALRRDPANAAAWEVLGAAYHMLGRFTAALKVGAPCLHSDCECMLAWHCQGSACTHLVGWVPRKHVFEREGSCLHSNHPNAGIHKGCGAGWVEAVQQGAYWLHPSMSRPVSGGHHRLSGSPSTVATLHACL